MEQVMIKIISGVYGYDTGTTVVGKSVTDDPFLLEKEKAQRIIDLGVAVVVEPEEPNNQMHENDEQLQHEQPGTEENDEQFEDNTEPSVGKTELKFAEVDLQNMTLQQLREFAEVDLQNMTLQQLREFGEPFGVKYKVGTKKEDFIEEMKAAMTAIQAEGDDTLPSFNDEVGVQQS